MRWGARLMLVVVGLLMSNAHLFALTNGVAGRPVPMTLSPEEREWITRHPVLRAGVLTNWAPFSYILPGGNLGGIDVDLLNLISQRTGLRFEIIPQKSWEELVANWDDLDLACSTTQTAHRERVADFTKAYATTSLVIVEREGEETFGPAAVLRQKKLALPRRYLLTQMLTERLPSARVVLAATHAECFQLVAKKDADATIVNLLVASHYLNSHPKVKLTISGVIAQSEQPLRMAVHREPDHELAVSILDKAMASISQDETDDIISKHLLFGLESRTRFALMVKRAKWILMATAIAGVLLVLWNLFMRKEILARQKAEAELREANESMRIFSHSLSHDLRAPLRGMTGMARILKEDCYEKLTPEEQDYLDRIITSGSHTDKMIVDVLTYSRATNSDWPMETVELDPLVHQLIDGFPPEQREYFQVVSRLPAVRGHSTLLSQSLGNLLSNAINYVPEDRTPRVEISATEEDSKVMVSVEDNGIGIEPKDRKRIFRIFERAAPGAYKGTGIGLAVVAKAAQRMGGSTGVESEVGKSSRFWIQLPRAGAQGPVSADKDCTQTGRSSS